LPLLEVGDVTRLLEIAAAEGIALATDRASLGSNALAIADGRAFAFRFGPDSRRLHSLQAPAMPVIEALGLSADLDTPEDLAFLRERGFTV
jgi:2-phospho-L-lactate guanylyltransferase